MRHLLTSLWPPSLRATLVGVVLLPLLAATAISGWYSLSYLEARTEERMQEDIELIARAIRLPLSHALEQGYRRTVQQAVESAFRIDRVYGVYVYDSEGETIAASGSRDATMGSDRAARIASRGGRQGEFEQAGDEPVFSYFVPLSDGGGRVAGLLQVTRKGSDFDHYLGEVRRGATLIFLATGAGLALIILLGHRWAAGRHLSRLEQALHRVETGDRYHRLAPRGPRELRTLATGLNRMLDAILHSHDLLAEQRRREAELTERLHQAEKMAALGQLAAGVAHELGSPLSTVDGKAARALRRDTLPERTHSALESIRREVRRMERIIRQLVDFGRANPLHRARVRADQPLQSALRLLRESGEAGSVEVRLDVEPPRSALNVDATRLEQALFNLLRNAVQAAETTVCAGGAPEEHGYRYWLDDDGPGIEEAARPHLFEPFFTTKRVGEGSGLGLAVAHAAVAEHGGHIEAGRSPLGGARFTIHLPDSTNEVRHAER